MRLSMGVVVLHVLLVFGAMLLSGCGSEPQGSDSQVKGLAAAAFLLDLENVRSLSSENLTVDPPNVPARESNLDSIRVRGNVTITIKTDETFAYNPVHWGIKFFSVNGSNSDIFRLKDDDPKMVVLSDPFSTGGDGATLTETTSGFVEFQVNLDENDWQELYDLSSQPTATSPRRIGVRLFYNIFDTLNENDSDGYKALPDIYMQNDVGVLRDAATVAVIGASSSEITLEFEGPADTTHLLPSQQYQEGEEKSVLSGYLVMYWKEGDCDSSGWIFQSNPEYRQNPEEPDPSFACEYGSFDGRLNSGAETCSLGCAATASHPYFAGAQSTPGDEDVANPLSEGACYKTATVPSGRSTFALTGLENNENYGIVVWPLDSSGSPGSKRSACLQATPLQIPLASGEGGGVKETVEDCFVATAASGGRASLAVHYWRILRDRWLDDWGVSAVYYRHGPRWAAWLKQKPQLQPVVNYVLQDAGSFLVSFDRLWLQTHKWLQTQWAALRSQWASFAAQWHGEASAAGSLDAKEGEAHPNDDLPPSKALRSREEVQAADDLGEPSKSLPANPIEEEPGEAAPTKGLPAQGIGEGGAPVDSERTKELRSAEVIAAEEEPPPRYPEGSAFAATRFSGGAFFPTDTALWDRYYPVGSPFVFSLQQTFRIADTSGEWGLGIMGSFQSHGGSVPQTQADGSSVADSVAGRKIGYYTMGLYAVGDWRFRYSQFPIVAPRFSLAGGVERLRETAKGEQQAEERQQSGQPGYTLWKPMVQAAVSLEWSFTGIFGKGFYDSASGYGARDILLGMDGRFTFDLSDHGFTQTGLIAGLSLVLLME